MSKPDLHIDVDAARVHGVDDDQDHGMEDDDMYTDDESSMEGEIDPDIDFNVMYALHTFVATVDGQASVVKGDSMVLLDDSNSYWWLVNVLKADEVGYIPAENIETPNDRLARLNKMRNVEIAASTAEEKNLGRLKLRNIPSEGGHGARPGSAMSTEPPDLNRRGVQFGEPTYVEHSGSDEDWSSEAESEEFEGELEQATQGHQQVEDSDDDLEQDQGEPSRRVVVRSEGGPLQGEDGASYEEHAGVHGMMMEPDDGMSWEDDAAMAAQSEDGLVEADPDSSITSNTYWDGLQPIASDSSHQSFRSHQSDLSAPSEVMVDEPTLPGPAAPSTAPFPAFEDAVSSTSSPRQQLAFDAARNRPASDQYSRAMSPPAPSSDPDHDTSPYGESSHTPSSQQSLSSFAREQLLDKALEHPEETRRISATPAVARRGPPLQSFMTGEPYETNEVASNMPRNFSSTSLRSDGGDSLDSSRKDSFDRNSPSQKKSKRSDSDDGKKKAGVFGGLFKKKGDSKKDKGNRSPGGGGADNDSFAASDEESTSRPQSAVPSSPIGPRPGSSASIDISKQSIGSPPPNSSPLSPSVSPHAMRLQQQDQRVQAAYQRYLTQTARASAEVSPAPLSYGTQAAATVAQSSAAQRIARASLQSHRPPSLVISNSNTGSASGPEPVTGVAPGSFAVLRVFAGQAVESDATFKTVLLKDSTTTAELLRQAMQRFGLGLGRDDAYKEYSLTVKGFDGDETVLGLDGHPLVVFNEMTRDDAVQAPLVRQSSIGSINSVASNLTLNPAISRLGDWSDDSVVKLYIHRNLGPPAPISSSASPRLSVVESLAGEPLSPYGNAASNGRFTLQIVVQPLDLPEGMSFDPSSEALLAARRRTSQYGSPSISAPTSPNLSQTERRRLFLLPANTTVAEAIETSLDRFGIAEGVVDGGDIVEDKLSNRKSITRVRYGLVARIDGQERPLQPSAKLIDIYQSPPTFRALPGPTDAASRRRSREIPEPRAEDLGPSDPVFILRKATLRDTHASASSRRRSRLSASLDLDSVELYRRDSSQTPKDGSNRLSASSGASHSSLNPSSSGNEGAGSHLDDGGGDGSSDSEQTATRDVNSATPTGDWAAQPSQHHRERPLQAATRHSASGHRPKASVSEASVQSRSTPDSSNLARSANLTASGGSSTPQDARQTLNPATPITTVSRGNSRAEGGARVPGQPFVTSDDFGVTRMLAIVRSRARPPPETRRKSLIAGGGRADVVEKLLFGEKMVDGGPGYEGKRGLVELQGRLDDFDKELDRLFDSVVALSSREKKF